MPVARQRHNQNWSLIGAAILILGLLAGFFVWGVQTTIRELDRGVRTNPNGEGAVEVKLDEARKILEGRGL